MKVIVEFTDATRERAVITLVPGWLGRLFRRATRRGIAVKRPDSNYPSWRWETTGRDVDADFAGYPIRRSLETSIVEALPLARLMVSAD